MSLSVIPSTPFLPLEKVALGRFVNDVDLRSRGYHEPPSTEALKSFVTEFTHTGQDQRHSKANFGSLIPLISTEFARKSRSHIEIAPKSCKAYDLDNPDAWFDKAISFPETKAWIEKAALRGKKIFMIVGIRTLTDTQLIQTSMRKHQLDGQVTAPVGPVLEAAGAITPLPNIIDPSIQGGLQNSDQEQVRHFAQGEQVCALLYRKVSYNWFSSRSVEKMELSGTRQWICMEGGMRDAYESDEDKDDDMIEVGLKDADQLSEDWTVVHSTEGLICVHS